MRFFLPVILIAIIFSSCKMRQERSEPMVDVEPGYQALFMCTSQDTKSSHTVNRLRIVATDFTADSQGATQNPTIFISIGDGVKVKAQCGEKTDAKNQSVFACWYSGGGLTVYWPNNTPSEEDVVHVDRKRLFGALTNARHRLKCVRHAEKEHLARLTP